MGYIERNPRLWTRRHKPYSRMRWWFGEAEIGLVETMYAIYYYPTVAPAVPQYQLCVQT